MYKYDPYALYGIAMLNVQVRPRYSGFMKLTNLGQVESRLRRVERQNRILIALLCAVVGLGSVAATKKSSGGTVISADEVRTHRLFLTNDSGNVVHQWVVRGGWLVEE